MLSKLKLVVARDAAGSACFGAAKAAPEARLARAATQTPPINQRTARRFIFIGPV
jgi:hypothetical protein